MFADWQKGALALSSFSCIFYCRNGMRTFKESLTLATIYTPKYKSGEKQRNKRRRRRKEEQRERNLSKSSIRVTLEKKRKKKKIENLLNKT